MDKIKKGMAVLTSFLLFITNAKAACDYETQVNLRAQALNVNATYEINQRVYSVATDELVDMKPEDIPDLGQDTEYYTVDYVVVDVMNITEDIYVVIEDETGTDVERIVHYSDTEEGTYHFEVPDTERIRPYKITIYSDHDDCLDEEIYNTTITTPKFNEYSYMVACNDEELGNEYYCQPYTTVDFTISEGEIADLYYKKMEEQTQTEEDNNKNNFWERYGVYIIVGSILIIGVVTTAILINRKRSRVI